MRKCVFTGAVAALCFISAVTEVQGQSGRRGPGGGWGAGSQYSRKFDPKTVETISGDVLSVDKFRPDKGMSYGIHLQLKTGTGTIPVHLGPAWYIENQDTQIRPNDKITVKGSRITFDEKPAIIASEVVKGDQTLRLRDEQGRPFWAGWRRQ